jgi:hypothetical protein
MNDVHSGNTSQLLKHLVYLLHCLLGVDDPLIRASEWQLTTEDTYKVRQEIEPLLSLEIS